VSEEHTNWTEAQAERELRSLELFGMRFGLDRMRRMMTALGSPQRRFDAIQILGTNGKTSTTRMTAAILAGHGLRTGAYTSPHLVSYRERVLIDQRELQGGAFAAAVARASWAAERVNRTLGEDDHVTQFELLTAAAFWALGRRAVDVAVVEAGLGGRYDATSVLDAPITVLTNVGLEHTRWLGPTVRDIAEEKLAPVRPGATVVLGTWLSADALAVAERIARERGARIVSVDERAALAVDTAHATPTAKGSFQRLNFALAQAAAEAYLRAAEIAPDARAIARAAATEVPGRLQVVGERPLTLLDGAHNPHAVAALVRALGELLAGRRVGLVMGVLEDKDAAKMLRVLLPLSERAWFTTPPSPRALSPAALQSLARQLGFEAVQCEPQPSRALERARHWAGEAERGANPERGANHGRAVLATGSIYLVGDLLRALGASDRLARRGAATGS
jgi:dihydrofolate synthase / folylpolyglutamate synthase